ncbi:uncharacterized protein [Typha angustifolia]|uniref:uncharacterized protein n=1 Tax=Typha angustifolia TaxID=59011 RepID=UPI003C2F517E
MASSIAGVRLVKCPKCHNILTELANIPVYKCGACGTILRAKIRTANGQKANLGEKVRADILDNSPITHEFSSAEKQLNAQSSELDDSLEQEKSPNLYASDLSVENTWKKQSLELGSNDTSARDPEIDIHKAANKVNSEGKLQKIYAQDDNGWNSQEDKSPELSHQGDVNMKQSDMIEDLQDSTNSDFSSKDVSCGTSSQEDTGDEDCNISITTGAKELFEGTFIHKEAQDPLDSKEKSAGEDDLPDNEMDSDAARHLQSQELPAKPLCEGDASAITGKSNSNLKAISFDSEDFHSVLNWLDPENAGLAVDSPNHQEGSQSTKIRSLQLLQNKILMKMDELRDELGELFGKSAEGKIRALSRLAKQESPTKQNSNFPPPRAFRPSINASPKYRSTHSPNLGEASDICLHCKTNLCSRIGHLRVCPIDSCLHLETMKPKIQMGYSHQPCCHEAQAHDTECKKLQTKVKRQPKHHCRPILGGAPFVICYRCLKLLQLPADFIISRRRLHKLQCGSCSEILLFSYRARTHASPQTPSEVAHPPSTVETNANTNTTTRPEISTPHSTDFARGDPISYTEEYGSFGISYSTETEHPLHVSRNSSSNFMDEANGKRLHRLMGYSSATELLYQHSDIDDDFDSIDPTSLHFLRHYEERSARESKGKGICMFEHPAVESSLYSMRMDEEEDSPKRLRDRRVGAPLSGLMRKGLRELNHGLEKIRLKST